jgi:four helix bundle protein
MKITRFEDLDCRQQARLLTRIVYGAVTKNAITASAVSVINNIAEGWAAQSNAEFIRFLTYSRRSCAEVQNCGYVALDQEYISEELFQEIYGQAVNTMQIIDGLLRYLRSHRAQRTQRTQRPQTPKRS